MFFFAQQQGFFLRILVLKLTKFWRDVKMQGLKQNLQIQELGDHYAGLKAALQSATPPSLFITHFSFYSGGDLPVLRGSWQGFYAAGFQLPEEGSDLPPSVLQVSLAGAGTPGSSHLAQVASPAEAGDSSASFS